MLLAVICVFTCVGGIFPLAIGRELAFSFRRGFGIAPTHCLFCSPLFVLMIKLLVVYAASSAWIRYKFLLFGVYCRALSLVVRLHDFGRCCGFFWWGLSLNGAARSERFWACCCRKMPIRSLRFQEVFGGGGALVVEMRNKSVRMRYMTIVGSSRV